jgi:hypothetical protein
MRRHAVRQMTHGPIPGEAPAAPSMAGRSLVLWIGDHHGAVLDQPGRDVVGTVALPLANVTRNISTLHRARRRLGLGVGADTEAYRNQCRADHHLRGDAFRRLGYDVRDLLGQPQLDIDRPMTDGQIEAYAAAHLNAQVHIDPTIFQTPGHVCTSATALKNDIALAEATLELVARRALREPKEGDPHGRRRSVFGALCVRSAELTPARIATLVDRYVRLNVDGYWVWAVDFKPSGLRAELMLRLVLALQENSGRPACPGGLGHLWQAALSRGAAAAVTGPGRAALAFDPDSRPAASDDDFQDGRRLHTYHGAVLGFFALDAHGDATRARVFAANPCPCGHHDANLPPHGRKQVTAHNQWWRLGEARVACVGRAWEASSRLRQRLPTVREQRLAAGMRSRLPAGWLRALEPWDEAPLGWGAADGRSS